MHGRSILAGGRWALATLCTLGVLSAQFTPVLSLRTTNPVVPVAQTFDVDIHVANVTGAVTGHWLVLVYDPTRLQPLAVTQGPYLALPSFQANWTSSVNTIYARSLNFPVGVPVTPATPEGVLATVTFRSLRSGPTNIDLFQFTKLEGPLGASIVGPRRDLAVQIQEPGDILAASGVPNPGQVTRLETLAPAHAGRFVFVAGSLGNSGILVPGAGTLPLDPDPLFFLAATNAPPYANSLARIDGTGYALTLFALPNVTAVVGLRVYFGSLVFDLGRFRAVSNSTWVDYLSNFP